MYLYFGKCDRSGEGEAGGEFNEGEHESKSSPKLYSKYQMENMLTLTDCHECLFKSSV